MTAGVIDIPAFTDTKVPDDEAAVLPPELACEVCGKELHYAGRGRKPKFCDEHKAAGNKGGKASGNSGGNKRALGTNANLAAQATEALCQINGLMAMGVMLAQLPMTAETIRNAEEGFREQAYNALLTDPGLCKTILKGGTASGKVSLLIAYGMLGAAVAPVGVMEFKARQEERRIAKDAEMESVEP